MREKTTLKSQGEGKGQKRKLAGAALTAALLLNPATSSAQDVKTVEQKQDKKEIVEKTPSVAKVDSTITWDEAVSGPNLEPDLEGRKISQEEIQEYIKNHKDELTEITDEKVAEELYKIIMEDEAIQEIVKNLVNRDDVRQAVLEGNEEFVQEELRQSILSGKEFKNQEKKSKENKLARSLVALLVAIIGSVIIQNVTIFGFKQPTIEI